MHIEFYGFSPYAHIFLAKESLQIFVYPYAHAFWMRYNAKSPWCAISDMDNISKKVKDGKIMFHDHHGFIHCKFPDQLCCFNSLVNIKIRAYFINKIEISFSRHTCRKRNSLEFTPA